jgi:hypothetical protein
MESVKIYRLLTGEDIISESRFVDITDREKEHYVFTNPYKIVYFSDPSGKGKVMLSLLPWIFHALSDDTECKVYSENVLTMVNPSKKLIEYYNTSLESEKAPRVVDKKPSYSDEISDMSEEELMETIADYLDDIGNKGKITYH